MLNIKAKISVILFSALVISACGGGGGDGSVTTSSATTTAIPTFPLAQAVANSLSSDRVIDYDLSGNTDSASVTGSGTITYSAAFETNFIGTDFEEQAALAQTVTTRGTETENGTTLPYVSTVTAYYTTNYDPLGIDSIGSYCVVQGSPSYPSSVKVGDTGSLSSSDCYQDSSMAGKIGTDVAVYVIEEDSATTAIVNIIVTTYSLSNRPVARSQSRSRIDQVGNMVPLTLINTNYETSPTSVMTFTMK